MVSWVDLSWDRADDMNETDELEELTLFLMYSHLGNVRPQSANDRIASAAFLHDSGKEHAYWQDYMMGLASTMSFLPAPLQPTFHDSDRAALASDLENVQSDLNQVWQEITDSESNCDGQGERRKIQTAE